MKCCIKKDVTLKVDYVQCMVYGGFIDRIKVCHINIYFSCRGSENCDCTRLEKSRVLFLSPILLPNTKYEIRQGLLIRGEDLDLLKGGHRVCARTTERKKTL